MNDHHLSTSAINEVDLSSTNNKGKKKFYLNKYNYNYLFYLRTNSYSYKQCH